jgi:long-chain acyl-CoA synthetase
MSAAALLHRAARFDHEGIATLYEGRTRTWGEVEARVARLAGGLTALGVARGQRVAILMLNQDRYVELYLAIAWIGAVVVPLNIRWNSAENQDCLTDCRPSLFVVDAPFAAMGASIAASLGDLRLLYADDKPEARPSVAEDYDELIANATPVADVEIEEAALCGIFYTGGTTGRSKAVMLSHRNLLASTRNSLSYRDPSLKRFLHVVPMFHLAGVGLLYASLMNAGANAIVRTFAPEGLAKAIESFRANSLMLVPTMIQMFVDQPGLDKYDLSSLKRVVYGASPISEAVLDRAMHAPRLAS